MKLTEVNVVGGDSHFVREREEKRILHKQAKLWFYPVVYTGTV